jgi:hypothetical protein
MTIPKALVWLQSSLIEQILSIDGLYLIIYNNW